MHNAISSPGRTLSYAVAYSVTTKLHTQHTVVSRKTGTVKTHSCKIDGNNSWCRLGRRRVRWLDSLVRICVAELGYLTTNNSNGIGGTQLGYVEHGDFGEEMLRNVTLAPSE